MSSYKKKVRQIKNNHTLGSTLLLQEFIELFTASKLSNYEILWSFAELGKIDSSMVVIHHFLKELKPAIGHDFHQRVQQYQRKWEHVNIDITINLQEYLPDKKLTILAHSHSGVVIEIMKYLLIKGYLLEVIQTESQPGGEGIIQAKALQELGLRVTTIKDDGISNIIGQVNCCFLGVDQYDENSFVNKIGSKNIVEIAHQSRKPVFVLGDTRKCVKQAEVESVGFFEKSPLGRNALIINESISA